MRKSGHLYKRGGVNPAYKRRFFRLFDGSLQYFTDETSDSHKGLIPLTGATLITDPAKNDKNGFSIKVAGSSRVFHIQADDGKTAQEWALAIAQSEGVKLQDDRCIGISQRTRDEKMHGESIDDWSSDEETDPTHATLNANLLLFGADIVQLHNAMYSEFRTADKDKDGWITEKELEPILATTYQRLGYPPSQHETLWLATRMHMDIVEIDEKGRIDKGEFMLLLKLVLTSSLALDKVVGIAKKDLYPGDKRFFRAMSMITRAEKKTAKAKPAKSKVAKVSEESLLLAAPASARTKRRGSGVQARRSSSPNVARPPTFEHTWTKLVAGLWESIGGVSREGKVPIRSSVERAYPYFSKVMRLPPIEDERKNRDSWAIANALLLDSENRRQVSFNKKELNDFCRRIVVYGLAMRILRTAPSR